MNSVEDGLLNLAPQKKYRRFDGEVQVRFLYFSPPCLLALALFS